MSYVGDRSYHGRNGEHWCFGAQSIEVLQTCDFVIVMDVKLNAALADILALALSKLEQFLERKT